MVEKKGLAYMDLYLRTFTVRAQRSSILRTATSEQRRRKACRCLVCTVCMKECEAVIVQPFRNMEIG
jgi:hypothetical protein